MALKEGPWKGAAGERDEWEQDTCAGHSSRRHRCLPHAPAGGVLGKGGGRMLARAHTDTFEGFPQTWSVRKQLSETS